MKSSSVNEIKIAKLNKISLRIIENFKPYNNIFIILALSFKTINIYSENISEIKLEQRINLIINYIFDLISLLDENSLLTENKDFYLKQINEKKEDFYEIIRSFFYISILPKNDLHEDNCRIN